ncbi:hypothetical protein CJ030_MR2G013595 [Morella rubra]|uniref:Uncharacterized protein n=1 Tax=Morella rubra TaxID=262757 RepID=A0A6A1WCE8_9ROSI|nr:hypothetical protein CJ030_MR2G013595 [Morella rubra]
MGDATVWELGNGNLNWKLENLKVYAKRVIRLAGHVENRSGSSVIWVGRGWCRGKLGSQAVILQAAGIWLKNLFCSPMKFRERAVEASSRWLWGIKVHSAPRNGCLAYAGK